MSEKKAARILTLLVVLCLIVGMAPAVAAAGTGTGFSLDTVTNEKFNAYWRNVDIYTIFNSADSGYLLTGWSTSGTYMCLRLMTRYNVADGTIPAVFGAMAQFSTQGKLGEYTSANYPLGELLPTTYDGTSGDSTFVYRNYREAWEAYSMTGNACRFLIPTSYISGYSTTSVGYVTACQLNDLGYISATGSVSYGATHHMYYSTSSTKRSFYGAYYFPKYPAADEISLTPNGYTVAAGVAKVIPCWLSTSTGPYNDPSIGWSIRVTSPLGVDESVAWASIDDDGILHLMDDSLAGYDIEITATWGDGISKSAPLYVRDLGDPGGSDPEIPETGVVERSEFLALQADVQALQEQVDEMPDRIAEGMEQVLNQEKSEADQGGNENVGDLTDAIPDYSEGFMDALRDFASSMMYSGTDAVLPIPAIVFPEIDGLVPSFTLLEANALDFGQVFQIVPDTVMKLVQALLTIALIVYCFKELYGTISYVLTLRGGGA